MTEEVDFVRDPRRVLIPVNLVSTELLEAWPTKSTYPVQEILETETVYLNDLNCIIQGYLHPLRNHLRADNEGDRVIATLFGNVEEICNLHIGFLGNLKGSLSDPHAFGQVFCTSAEKFKIYAYYCTNYDSALECLLEQRKSSKDLEQFIKSCQLNLQQELPLESQIIKPVQRLMRYLILLKEVLKGFDRNHHCYHSLDSAHRTMTRVVSHINEVKKQKENAERVLDLQSNTTGWTGKNTFSAYGELIIEDSCKVGHRGVVRQVILFDKLLLFLKKKDDKKYVYKAHILACELHIHDKFSESNSTMFKVSSLIQRHSSFVVDVGRVKKQKEWLNLMHALVRRTLEQTKRGRLLPIKSNSQPALQQQAKRRKIVTDEEVDFQHESNLDTRSHSKANRVSNKRRSRGDVRELFSGDDSSSARPLSYSVPSPQTTSMQTIPEFSEPPLPPARLSSAPVPLPPRVGQRLETISEQESKQTQQSGSKDGMPLSNSMDSLVSLTDVDVGVDAGSTCSNEGGVSSTGSVGAGTGSGGRMETDGGGFEEVDGPVNKPPLVEDEGAKKPIKLFRRSAIKVKRSLSHHTVGSSTSVLIKARAMEARAASKSPEQEREEEQDSLLQMSSISSSDLSFSGPHTSLRTGDGEPSLPISTAGEDSGIPGVFPTRVQADSAAVMESESAQEGMDAQVSLSKISPFKRPRSYSHDQDTLSAIANPEPPPVLSNEQSIRVEIVDQEGEEDGLELGESCGQAKMRGRADMPLAASGYHHHGGGGDGEDGAVSAESSEWELSGASSSFMEQSTSSFLGGGRVSADGEDEENEEDADFMIVEDSSSDSEEDEDLEVIGDELEASLLEAADAGESTSPHHYRDSPSLHLHGDDQVVPKEDKAWVLDQNPPAEPHLSEFFSTLNGGTSPTSELSPVTQAQQGQPAASPVFRFEASPTHQLQRGADIYGTLPHKKKAKSAHVTPTSRPLNPPKNSNQSLGGFRRAEGFSRLLEFTRQQQVEMDATAAGFDVTQSLPVYTCPLDEGETCPEDKGLEEEKENKGLEEEKEDSQTSSGGGYDGESTLLHKPEDNLPAEEAGRPSVMEDEASSLDSSKLLAVGGGVECGSEGVHGGDGDKSGSAGVSTGVEDGLQGNKDYISESTHGGMGSIEDVSFNTRKSEVSSGLPSSDAIASVGRSPDLAKRNTARDDSTSPVTELIDDTAVSTVAGTDTESPPRVSSGTDSYSSKQPRPDKLIQTDSGGNWNNSYIALGVGVASVLLFFAISSYFK